MGQLMLDLDAPPAPAPRESEATTTERFERWLAGNPRFWPTFYSAACRLRDQGRKRISVKMIVELLRDDPDVQTTKSEGWSIDNRFTSRLARKLVDADGSFAALVELRPLTSK